MQTVSVKAVEGRVVREDPKGPFVPSDRYVTIPLTKYVQRLIDVHGDLVVEPIKTPPTKPVEAPKADAKKEENS